MKINQLKMSMKICVLYLYTNVRRNDIILTTHKFVYLLLINLEINSKILAIISQIDEVYCS